MLRLLTAQGLDQRQTFVLKTCDAGIELRNHRPLRAELVPVWQPRHEMVIELRETTRSRLDPLPPQEEGQRDLILDRPPLHLVEPRVPEARHSFGVSPRHRPRRPETEPPWHPER
jgi:hypothetical protein